MSTLDNRNWELSEHTGLAVQRLKPEAVRSRWNMESATIAANGFRFGGALRPPCLCVSDKPLHGRLKAARDGVRFLQDPGGAASEDRIPCDGRSWREHAVGADSQSEIALLSRKRPSSEAGIAPKHRLNVFSSCQGTPNSLWKARNIPLNSG